MGKDPTEIFYSFEKYTTIYDYSNCVKNKLKGNIGGKLYFMRG